MFSGEMMLQASVHADPPSRIESVLDPRNTYRSRSDFTERTSCACSPKISILLDQMCSQQRVLRHPFCLDETLALQAEIGKIGRKIHKIVSPTQALSPLPLPWPLPSPPVLRRTFDQLHESHKSGAPADFIFPRFEDLKISVQKHKLHKGV